MIIFLDIDGVLNQLQSWHLDSHCVENLGLLCNKLSGKVVLTSSWRLGYFHDINKCSPQIRKLLDLFKLNSVEVIGRTKDLNNRGLEIKEYCERYDISNYVILDDDKSLFSNYKNLYVVNYRTGLILKDVKKIIREYS